MPDYSLLFKMIAKHKAETQEKIDRIDKRQKQLVILLKKILDFQYIRSGKSKVIEIEQIEELFERVTFSYKKDTSGRYIADHELPVKGEMPDLIDELFEHEQNEKKQ